jgi:tetratricopeptide (TPR) repeat protein
MAGGARFGGGGHAVAYGGHAAANYAYGHGGYRTFGGYGGPRYHGGYGYRGYGYGWGYPVGLGLGFGLGYGLGYGYGSWGYPYYGYYGYSPYPATVVVAAPAATTPYPAVQTYSGSVTTPINNSNPSPPSAIDAEGVPPAPIPAPPPEGDPESASEFSRRAETAFFLADYPRAIHEWRHAVIDDPKNPKLLLFLSQALFAAGRYDEAAGAAQAGLRKLPKDQWGSVVAGYKDLYGRPEDYTAQLRALEAAIKEQPRAPALRFLAGYHYSFLGFRKQAVDQLNIVVKDSSRDDIARDLLRDTQDRIAKSTSLASKPQGSGNR